MKPIPLFIKSVTPGKPPADEPESDIVPNEPDQQQKKTDSDVVENKPDMGNFAGLLALLAERGAGGGDFGPHNVKEGHHVAFSAGAFAGAGRVSAVGQDGLHVTDSAKREHRIHWGEVTGHHPGPDPDEAPAKGKDAL
jgi:hypothetical protein